MSKEQIRKMQIQRAVEWMRAQAASGLGKDDWCEKNGIKRWQFYRWQRVLKNMMLESVNATGNPYISEVVNTDPVFVELPCAPAVKSKETFIPDNFDNNNFDNNNFDNSRDSDGKITISYGDFSIGINNGVDEALLTTVLKAVSNVK